MVIILGWAMYDVCVVVMHNAMMMKYDDKIRWWWNNTMMKYDEDELCFIFVVTTDVMYCMMTRGWYVNECF